MTEASAKRWAIALELLSPEDRQAIAFDGQDRLDVLKNLQNETNTAKEIAVEKRWRCRWPGRGGETVILRDLLSKIVTWLDRFKEIGDIVVQYDPVHAALPWAGVRFLLKVAVDDFNKFDFVVEAAETIAHCISRFTVFESIYLDHNGPTTKGMQALEEALVQLYASIFKYLARAKQYFEQNTAKRVFKSVIKPQEEFKGLLLSIDEEQTNVDRHASLIDAERNSDLNNRLKDLSIDERDRHVELRKILESIDGPICRMNRQLNSIEDRLTDTDRINILAWLSSQPYQKHHQEIMRKALRGSGQWLLHDPVYKQWHDSSVSSLLWLHGPAGSGKSTLVSIIIEDAKKKSTAGQDPEPVYFYCSRSTAEPERQDPDAVLASVSRQLSSVRDRKALLPPAIERYKKQGEGFRPDGLYTEQSRELVVELIELHGAATIVVDALDECDPEKRHSLLNAFEYILKESAGLVKIFVSSRDDQDITWTLQDYPSLIVEKKKNCQDIEAFVKIETEFLVKQIRLLRNSQARGEMQALIIEQVCEGADGMFRWASLQLEVLCQQKTDEDICARLGRLPPRLEQLYGEIYSQLTSTGEVACNVIGNTLKWLLCAQTTLDSSAFLTAINVSRGATLTIEHVLDLCHNLVVYDQSLDIFRFAHLSVREFLEKRVEFSMISCHVLAAESCLLHMIAAVDTSSQASALGYGPIADLHEELDSTKYTMPASFLGYALNLWMSHCQLASQNARTACTSFGQLFRSFISSEWTNAAFNAWVQWFCRTMQLGALEEWSLQLRSLLCRYPTYPLPSFYVAVTYGFSEIVNNGLQKDQISAGERAKARILAALCAQDEVFDILMETDREIEITPLVLRYAVQYLEKETLAKLLGRCESISLDQDIMMAGIARNHDGIIDLLLEKDLELTVTEKTLDFAMSQASLHDFRLLLNRTADGRTSIYNLSSTMSQPSLDKIAPLLETAGSPSKASCSLMQSWLPQSHYDDLELEKLELLLIHGGDSGISTEVMGSAAGRPTSEMLNLLLRHGGKITQDVLVANADEVSLEVLEILLEHGCEINAETLKVAAEKGSWNASADTGLLLLLDRADESVIAEEISSVLYNVARCGDQCAELMRRLLDRTDENLISQEMSGLLRCAAGYSESENTEMLRLLLDRAGENLVSQGLSGLLRDAAKRGTTEVMRLLLDRADENLIYQELSCLLRDAAGHGRKGMLRLLLHRAEDYHITEDTLMFAAYTEHSEVMQLLLDQAETASVTEYVVLYAVLHLDPNALLRSLARFGEIDVTNNLLEAATQNRDYGAEWLRTMLKKADGVTFPEEVFIEATKNLISGKEIIRALEDAFGPIEMTEIRLTTLIRARARGTNLLRWFEPQYITGKVLMVALGESNYIEVSQAVVERSGHLPITLEVLKAAAKTCDLYIFRFLWARGRIASTPESLIEAAARNELWGYEIVEFLLEEAEEIHAGERLSVAVAKRTEGSVEIFDLLLAKGIPVVNSQQVLNAAVEAYNKDEFSKENDSSIKWILDYDCDASLEITDELFQIAASNGKEDTLYKLSECCDLEDPLRKWLDIAKLFNSARKGDNDTLKDLLDCGIELDTPNPQGRTPLFAAVQNYNSEGAMMLLSRGALPDPVVDGVTPLCYCAYENVFDSEVLDLIKILVDAGASLDFRDPQGRTPEEIALKRRNTSIFLYLKQSRLAKGNTGQASSPFV